MKYDVTLKELFQSPPRELLRMLTGEQAAELLTVELPTVRMRRPDLVVRLADGRILHLELQSGDDVEMAWRMLEYYQEPAQCSDQSRHRRACRFDGLVGGEARSAE